MPDFQLNETNMRKYVEAASLDCSTAEAYRLTIYSTIDIITL